MSTTLASPAGKRARTARSVARKIVSVSGAGSAKVAEDYARWGKGVHAASLNLGDCFAYALARELGRPLLFVGDDFKPTPRPPGPGSTPVSRGA